MIITDEAKLFISEAMTSNNCDCLTVTLQESCCGTSLGFELVKLSPDDKPISINGISVLMDEQTQVRAEKVTLAIEDGDLIVLDDTQSCCC